MFGADTPLVMDALQMAALAAAAGGGAIYLILRRRKRADRDVSAPPKDKFGLEQRVRVLERIATDHNSERLSDEIEALRDNMPQARLEGQTP